MTYSDNNLRYLPIVERPVVLVFSDFDETYFAHERDAGKDAELRELEDYLVEKTLERALLFGWVSGSGLENVLSRVREHHLRLPHFIASGLGTDITHYDQSHFSAKDPRWEQVMLESGYSPDKIAKLIERLDEEGIPLVPQDSRHNGRFKTSFYYRSVDSQEDSDRLGRIETLARQEGIRSNVGRCNPLAGDPEDSFDVDLTPLVAGKRNVVEFVISQTQVDPLNTLAFGDSQNDIEMLETVAQGYLLGNATDGAKRLYPNHAEKHYAQGILSVLREQSFLNPNSNGPKIVRR